MAPKASQFEIFVGCLPRMGVGQIIIQMKDNLNKLYVTETSKQTGGLYITS